MSDRIEQKPFSYLEDMVRKPTWKEVLLDLIASNRIDPWNIDIVTLADAFLKKVKEMEKVDFFMHANVILAASILLRYKSEYLRSLSVQSDMTDFIPEADAFPEGPEEIPILTLSARIPPRRPVTLEELMQEMEKIIKYDDPDRMLVKVPRGGISEIVDFEVSEHDVDKDIVVLKTQLDMLRDPDGWSLFSRLTAEQNTQALVYTLLCLLHMAQMNKIDLRQDEMFGEIFIKTIEKMEKVEKNENAEENEKLAKVTAKEN